MRSANYLLITAALAFTAQAQPEYCKTLPPDCGAVPKECLPVQYSLVYTRQPRAPEDFANWQHWYDGGIPDRFTESDLVLDDLKGTQTAIHNCTTNPTICAAHDGRVSPDGTKIAYTLAEGTALYPVKTWGDGRLTPPIEFTAIRYSIYIYDTRTKTTSKLEDNARMPDWCGNDCLVFASNRAGTYVPWGAGGPVYPNKSLQIYRAKLTSAP